MLSKVKRDRRRIIRILSVGDVHGQWDMNDHLAVLALNPDLTLFVGDYGNENVRLVKEIAKLTREVPSAAVLGNHDGWDTFKKQKNRLPGDVILKQMDVLGPAHVSYKSRSFPHLDISVIGGRPFSWGGPHWKHPKFYKQYFNIRNVKDSITAISDSATQARDHTVVFLAHNGPHGLGGQPWDPCGKDWGESPGGDYGDLDLRKGIEAARSVGKRVPLVVFGHMHRELSHSFGSRKMVAIEKDGSSNSDTVMVNTAIVPRKKSLSGTDLLLSHFVMIELRGSNHRVESVEEIWCNINGEVKLRQNLYCNSVTNDSQVELL